MNTAGLLSIVSARWPGDHLATTGQLGVAGLDHRVLTQAVSNRVLIRIRKGVYVRSELWNALPSWEQDRLRIEAHWLATRGTAVYSHVSAARLGGGSVWDSGGRVHLSVPYSAARSSHAPDVVAHSLAVPEEDLTSYSLGGGKSALATSWDRTVVDCARILDVERAAVIGDSALRRGATLEGIRAASERSGVIRGSRRVEQLLGLLDSRSESAGETRARIALRAAGLPEPVLQHEIQTPEGLFRADFAWPDLLVILEFDGTAKYFDYRPVDAVLLEERRREASLGSIGWTLVRTRWAELATPEVIVAKVEAAFARARRLSA